MIDSSILNASVTCVRYKNDIVMSNDITECLVKRFKALAGKFNYFGISSRLSLNFCFKVSHSLTEEMISNSHC